MSALITLVLPIIRLDFIDAALESLYKFTDRSKFRLIVVDQSIEGWKGEADMVIKQKNQGFATGANTGLIHGLRWGTPYLAVMNDDLLFIYDKWLEDALEEFNTAPNIIAVNPMCPKIPMWGYGMTGGEYLEILPYKEEYSEEDIKYLKAGDYNEAEIKSRTPYEIPKSFPFTQRGVVDGFAGWLAIFKKEGLIEKGLYDERFVWGGGEDYDWMARAYSCAWPIPRETCDSNFHRRAVSTMKSWVYHFWGKSKDESSTLDPQLFTGREAWNNLDFLWPSEINQDRHCDVWAHPPDLNNPNVPRKPLKRIPEVYIHKP